MMTQEEFLKPYIEGTKTLGGGPVIEKDSEISSGWSGSTSAKQTKNRNRSLDTRSCHMTVTHVPTGVKVEGDIKPGNYGKKEMQNLRANLKIHLVAMLDSAVRHFIVKKLKENHESFFRHRS